VSLVRHCGLFCLTDHNGPIYRTIIHAAGVTQSADRTPHICNDTHTAAHTHAGPDADLGAN
jgi:hypothetical protein